VSSPIIEAAVDPADVNRFIVEKLAPILEGENSYVAQAALLTIIFNIASPFTLTEEEVTAGVGEISAWLSLYITSLRGNESVN